jgi:outer membrane protein assembly factor BamB/tRNA A-37 threonylcarbamoyl transferase component Bud32
MPGTTTAGDTADVEGEVFGPYRLDALIGSGGMGEVYRAYDSTRNRIVALKRLPRQLGVDAEYRARFQRESALVAQLREPHIIPIHDYGEIDGQLYIDMRLVEGADLAKVLDDGPLAVARAVDVVSQIADALDAAHHEGLVHRDVKPSNILLVGRPGDGGISDRGVAYLVDFGIARAVDGPTLSAAGLAMGSSGYMAPERLTGDHWDLRVDVYSLACVLYECLVGSRPFPATSLPAAINAHLNTPPPLPSASRPDLPDGFDAVIAIGMAKNPQERYASAGALAYAARSLVTGRVGSGSFPVPGTRPSTGPRHTGSGAVPHGDARPTVSGAAPVGPAARTGSGPARPYPPGAAPAAVLSGPQRTGAPPEASGPVDAPAPGGLSRRRLLLGAGAVAAVAVTGGAVYGGLRLAGVVGGAGPWVFETGDKVYSSPLVVDGVVYIGSNDGNLYALDAGNGSEMWRYPTGSSITSSPTIAGDLVYVGGNDQRLHAVEAATGKVRWTAEAGGVVHSSPTVEGGTVYVGSRSAHLLAFAADTGQPRWQFPAGDWFNSSPAVAGGVVFVGCRDKNIYAVDAATGVERWHVTTTSTVDSSPTVVGDRVYIGADDYRVRCLSTKDGAQSWEFWAKAGVVSGPVVDKGVVYVGSDDGNLYAIEADTGRQRWAYTTGGGIRSSPAISGTTVYVGSQDRSLHAVDLGAGTAKWRYATPAPLDDSSPAVADGLVYIGSLSNGVFAVDATTGQGPATGS